jgi:hypothetical protein
MALVGRGKSDGPRELVSGIDALYLSAHAQCLPWLVERLEVAKGRAVAADAAQPFSFGNEDFELLPYPWRRYPYCLRNGHGRIGISPRGTIPPFRFQPKAEYLHGVGAEEVANWFESLLSRHLGLVVPSVSRLDLFADFEGLSFHVDDLDRFVGRARSRTYYEQDTRWTSFQFGRRKSGTISARIYDKTEEIRQHSRAGYWREIWGRAIEGGPPVTRVEFELSSTAIRNFGLCEPMDTIKAAGSMWTTLTREWLSLRDRTDDETRSRWPVAAEWHSVQRARLAEGAHGIERTRNGKRRADLRWVAPRFVGSAATIAALLGTTDIEDTLAVLPRLIENYCIESGRPFAERIAEKATRG